MIPFIERNTHNNYILVFYSYCHHDTELKTILLCGLCSVIRAIVDYGIAVAVYLLAIMNILTAYTYFFAVEVRRKQQRNIDMIVVVSYQILSPNVKFSS